MRQALSQIVRNRYGFLRRVADAKSLLDEAALLQDWLRGSCAAWDGVVFEAGWERATVLVDSWRREVRGVVTRCENALGKSDACRSQAMAVECLPVARAVTPA